MNVATVLPKHHLDLGRSQGLQLALAHIAAQDEEYLQWFVNTTSDVILDNGAAELGASVPNDLLIDLAERMNPTWLVIPDVVNGAAATFERGVEFLAAMKKIDARKRPKLIAVPQGKTVEEYYACFRGMLRWNGVGRFGISRFVVDSGMVPTRAHILGFMRELTGDGRGVHLLGCPGDPWEIFTTRKQFPALVKSCDSGLAAICTRAGVTIEEGFTKPPSEVDFSEDRLDVGQLRWNMTAWITRASTGRWPL